MCTLFAIVLRKYAQTQANYNPFMPYFKATNVPRLPKDHLKHSVWKGPISLLSIFISYKLLLVLDCHSMHQYTRTAIVCSRLNNCLLCPSRNQPRRPLRLVLAAYCSQLAAGRPHRDCNAGSGRQRFVQAQCATPKRARIGLKFCMRSFKRTMQLFQCGQLTISKKVVFHSTIMYRSRHFQWSVGWGGGGSPDPPMRPAGCGGGVQEAGRRLTPQLQQLTAGAVAVRGRKPLLRSMKITVFNSYKIWYETVYWGMRK